MNKLDSKQSANVSVKTKRYMPGLDGLRALSVLAVIAYHLNFPWASGGFLGVGIFFTISGYLITDQLMMEWQNTGKINLMHFWNRRIRRLIPALFFMLATVYLWLVLFEPSRIEALRGDFISAVLYINNWWKIFNNVSYFESFGPQSPIGHLWSLAIEEQFYLLWPVILIIGLHFVPKRGKLTLLVTVGAAASILAMGLIYKPGADPSRVYYGTDTRAFALLIGAIFAIGFPSCKLSEQISAKRRFALDIMGGSGLLGVLIMIWKTNEYQASLYVGGLAVFSVISAIVIVVLAHPASSVAKFIGCKPFRWIGIRSYSLYLWHYPVIILTNPTVDTGEFNGSRIVFQIAVSFLLAELSWKFVEDPIRRGAFATLRKNMPVLVSSIFKRSLLVVAVILLPLPFTYCSDSSAVADSSLTALPAADEQAQTDTSAADTDKLPPQAADSSEPASDMPEQLPDEQNPAATPPIKKDETGKGIIAIGDSVILDAAPFLEELLPGIIIDGKVGRQMSQAQETINQLKADDRFGNRIIIELGTNGTFSTKQLHQLLGSLGDIQQVILVNTRVPRKWQDTVNSDLKKVAAEFPNVAIADWFSASKGKASFFSDDGVHLTREGAGYYASMLAEAIQ